MGNASTDIHRLKCPWCSKEPHYIALGTTGNHKGDGGELGENILDKFYNGEKMESAQDHPLSIPPKRNKGPREYLIAQAHHLICTESMMRGWAKICKNYGYDINHHKNGIFFPGDMRVACSLKIPLHQGNHDSTNPNYVGLVKDFIKGVKQKVVNKKACDKPEEIIVELNNLSMDLCDGLLFFTYKITSDGAHYDPLSDIGCSNFRSIQDKKRKRKPNQFVFTNSIDCELKRNHKIRLERGVHYFRPGEVK